MTLSPPQVKKVRFLRASGHGIKDIAKRTGHTRRDVQEALWITPEEEEKKRRAQIRALQNLRPPERSEAVHDQVIRTCFPELFVGVS